MEEITSEERDASVLGRGREVQPMLGLHQFDKRRVCGCTSD